MLSAEVLTSSTPQVAENGIPEVFIRAFTERTPFAFDLSSERRRILRDGLGVWSYFYDELSSYLSEAYGKVGVRTYEHLILSDARGRERLWFNSGRLELAKDSYAVVYEDQTLPLWYRSRGQRDLLWLERLEERLQSAAIGDRFVDLSPAPFEIPLQEREKSGFGEHSFLRVHEVILENGQKKLMSKAMRHHLALEEQQALFGVLTTRTVDQGELLGEVDRLDNSIGIGTIERIISKLYENTPNERKIVVTDGDKIAASEITMESILQRRSIQNWIKGVFEMMRNPQIKEEDILTQFKGLEMAVKELLNGSNLNLEVFECAPAQLFLDYSFRETAAVRKITDVPYKPGLLNCPGAGAGFSGMGTISLPMTYEVMTAMGNLSPAERKYFCISCGACGKKIMCVVEPGEKCPKCNAVRECA